MGLPIVILAGGLGTRLGSAASNKPKILMPINGKPFIDLQLEWLLQNDVNNITYCIGHLGSQVVKHIKSLQLPKKIRINFSWDGEFPLGTGGAVLKAAQNLDSKFLVTYGDSYLRADLKLISETFYSSNFLGLMTVFRNNSKFDVSNVKLKSGQVIEYVKNSENSEFQYIDYGILGLSKELFVDLHAGPQFDLGKIILKGISQGQMMSYEIHERFYEVGSIKGIRALEEFLKE